MEGIRIRDQRHGARPGVTLGVHRELNEHEGGGRRCADREGRAALDGDLQAGARGDPCHRQVDDVVRRSHRGHAPAGDETERDSSMAMRRH